MLRMNPTRSQCGFTLLELVFATSITGAVLMAFGASHLFLLAKAESSHGEGSSHDSIELVIREMENAIRMSEEIQKSGSDILQVETRYFIDSDDELETVRYWRDGTTLKKSTASGTGPFGDIETLLSDVTAFDSFSLEIADEFVAAEYDTVLVEGDTRSIDTSVQATYTVAELGDVDPDLAVSYDAALEALEVDATAGHRFLTVTPPLPGDNLSLRVTFTPLEEQEYFITYGDLSADETRAHSIRLRFTPGQVNLEYWDSNVRLEEIVNPYAWAVGEDYTLGFMVIDDTVRFWINDGSATLGLGSIQRRLINQKPVHLEVRVGGRARFDNLNVKYPLVDLSITMTPIGSSPIVRVGGATTRQP